MDQITPLQLITLLNTIVGETNSEDCKWAIWEAIKRMRDQNSDAIPEWVEYWVYRWQDSDVEDA
jgi:hypothetical protein